jgi:lysylphosphatidylglycerol synthetase-like protein (DUF2156 family)
MSHQLSVTAGFLLLGLSRGIEYRVKKAYELTMIVLILAAVFSIFKGLQSGVKDKNLEMFKENVFFWKKFFEMSGNLLK